MTERTLGHAMRHNSPMSFSRRYVGMVLLPPIVLLLPIAIAFLVHVTRAARWLPMASTAAGVYAAGAILFYLAVEPDARRAEQAIDAGEGPSPRLRGEGAASAADEGRH